MQQVHPAAAQGPPHRDEVMQPLICVFVRVSAVIVGSREALSLIQCAPPVHTYHYSLTFPHLHPLPTDNRVPGAWNICGRAVGTHYGANTTSGDDGARVPKSREARCAALNHPELHF